MPDGWELLIDGGHNDSAGAVLADQARQWQAEDPRPLHLVVGMVRRKNPVEFLGPLAPYAASLTCVPIPGEASAFAANDLKEAVAGLGFARLTAAASVENALATLPTDGPPGRVLITGSLYLLGAVLAHESY